MADVRDEDVLDQESEEELEEGLEAEIIMLADENGNAIEFAILDDFDYKGERYITLIPLDDDEADEEAGEEADEDDEAAYDGEAPVEVAILRVVGEGEDEEYDTIDDDDLLNELFEVFHDRHVGEFDFE